MYLWLQALVGEIDGGTQVPVTATNAPFVLYIYVQRIKVRHLFRSVLTASTCAFSAFYDCILPSWHPLEYAKPVGALRNSSDKVGSSLCSSA